MRRVATKYILNIILIGFVWGFTSAFQNNNGLTRQQAINLAEQFIIDNGYTNLPGDSLKISFELFDRYEKNYGSILKRRYNTLQPKAFCIYEDEDKWNVGFLASRVNLTQLDSKQLNSDLSGRAVIVMKNNKEIKIAHKDPLFSRFIKL